MLAGEIRVGHLDGWNVSTFIFPLIQKFQSAYPQVAIKTEGHSSIELVQMLKSGRLRGGAYAQLLRRRTRNHVFTRNHRKLRRIRRIHRRHENDERRRRRNDAIWSCPQPDGSSWTLS
jgi:hypothetical protein